MDAKDFIIKKLEGGDHDNKGRHCHYVVMGDRAFKTYRYEHECLDAYGIQQYLSNYEVALDVIGDPFTLKASHSYDLDHPIKRWCFETQMADLTFQEFAHETDSETFESLFNEVRVNLWSLGFWDEDDWDKNYGLRNSKPYVLDTGDIEYDPYKASQLLGTYYALSE